MEEEARRTDCQVGPRETLLLDRGWLFHLGDIDSPVPNTHLAGYMANKAGYARGAARGGFDDSDWRPIDLPHDWAVEQPFDPNAHLSGGYRPRGMAWYRRHFRVDETDRHRRLRIQFDGVATHCTVWINGHLLHRNWCGYTPFTIDITDIAQFGDDLNVIAVRVDATYMEGWWYEGAGIYRHVWLIKSHLVNFVPSETGVFTEKGPGDDWQIFIACQIENGESEEQDVTWTAELLGPVGQVVAEHRQRAKPWLRVKTELRAAVQLKAPALWSLESPTLYWLRLRIEIGGAVVDETLTRFGFRTIRWDANDGFFLNDRPVRLNGTCNHQDHAGVGVAVPDSIHEFRIRRLKEMGCNAYRAAHNPPAPEFLDACDRLGMLVLDENRNFGSSPEHLQQLSTLVKRDRNHPCVIAWSICNEESIQGTAAAAGIARTMAAVVRGLDPYRPVTAAVSGGLLGRPNIADAVDAIGINYQLPIYDAVHERNPHRAIYAAETHCVCATRGAYLPNAERQILPADDSYAAPWGATGRETWRALGGKPFVAGIFIWTGFDYRGEPTPHTWPCVNSFFGMLDTCGFAKDGFYLYKAYWTCEPFVHLLPHWNWTVDEGTAKRVIAYSNCDSVELLLNGRSLGRKDVHPTDMVEWWVPYEAGELRAVGWRGSEVAAETLVATTGPAVGLGLRVDPAMPGPLIGDGEHALPVTVFAVDAAGRPVPTAGDFVTLAVRGPARVIGVGNGDPTSHEPDRASQRSLFNGLAQAIVQSTGPASEVTMTAMAPGLAAATLSIPVAAAAPRPAVPLARRRWLITDWRVSPRSVDPPPMSTAAHDMNTWQRIKLTGAHLAVPAGETGHVVYASRLKLPQLLQSRGARLVLHGISGDAEIFIGGIAVTTTRNETVNLPLSQVCEAAEVAIRFRASDKGAGFMDLVELVPADLEG